MNERLPDDVVRALNRFGLMKFWKVGSNNYPNIINAWIEYETDCLVCEFLQLNGFTKLVNYPLSEV